VQQPPSTGQAIFTLQGISFGCAYGCNYRQITSNDER
jgi:hypothetical protein